MIQSTSYLLTYEAIYGQLPDEERDQFYYEQQIPAALIGIQPDHLPSTFQAAMDFLHHAHQRFAVGLVGRRLLAPYDKSDYPKGTAMGDLPWLQRKVGLYVTRVISDMAALTLLEDERMLYSVNRRPKMLTKRGVRLSLKLYSAFMRSRLGMKAFAWYLPEQSVQHICRRVEDRRRTGV